MTIDTDYITLPEYADAHGIVRSTVTRKIKAGNFAARRFGRIWMIKRDEPWIDCRIKSGKYVGSRDKDKIEREYMKELLVAENPNHEVTFKIVKK